MSLRGEKKKERKTAAIRIHDKTASHPGSFRSKLKKLDPETHALTTWVSQHSENWYAVECDLEDFDDLLARVQPLRQSGLTVLICDDPDQEDDEDGCPQFQKGRRCRHGKPYCRHR